MFRRFWSFFQYLHFAIPGPHGAAYRKEKPVGDAVRFPFTRVPGFPRTPSVQAHSDNLATSRFDYPLPEELIAQEPSERRDRSRLLVVERGSGRLHHRAFREIGDYLPAGGRLYRNNASVLPARLRGFRAGGGAVECLLLRPGERPDEWRCLVKPGKKLSPGTSFGVEGEYRAEIVDVFEGGERRVRFLLERDPGVIALANRLGEVPLPPYIRRDPEDPRREMDRRRYETVYASRERQVAVAAPTAGLHFTPELLDALRDRGFSTAEITLHVGAGTFQPIQTEHISDHAIHREIYEIPPETRRLLETPGNEPRIAVGTTTVRALEDYGRRRAQAADPESPFTAEADLFLYPPAHFELTDALITNFHLPRSTLLCLVASFLTPGGTGGIEWLKEIYAEAVARRYRFYSYGDAMLIV